MPYARTLHRILTMKHGHFIMTAESVLSKVSDDNTCITLVQHILVNTKQDLRTQELASWSHAHFPNRPNDCVLDISELSIAKKIQENLQLT